MKRTISTLAILATLIAGAASAETNVHASWYGGKFHGRQMASGPVFDKNNPRMAAHKTLPFCTQVRLRNPKNGREHTIVVTDRGPYIAGREFDLSRAGADKLGYRGSGVTQLQVVETKRPKRRHRYGDRCDSSYLS